MATSWLDPRLSNSSKALSWRQSSQKTCPTLPASHRSVSHTTNYCHPSSLQGIYAAVASKQYGEEKFLSGLVAEVRMSCVSLSAANLELCLVGLRRCHAQEPLQLPRG